MPFLYLQGSDQLAQHLFVHLSTAQNVFEHPWAVLVLYKKSSALSFPDDSKFGHTASACLYQTISRMPH